MVQEADSYLRESYEQPLIYEPVVAVLRKEIGTVKLAAEHREDRELLAWILHAPNVDNLLDALEFLSRIIEVFATERSRSRVSSDFVSELNARMLEDGFGYQIQDGQIVQVNSQFAHSEIVVPALTLLSDPKYAAASAEFRQAHEEFRRGEYEDCIHDCSNAFESVLKVILTGKKWTFNANDTASKLLAVAFSNNLIPTYMQAEFSGLRTILESVTPTVRNKTAGHGAGVSIRNIPQYIAVFQLHQTAAAILLLIEAAK